MWHKTKMLYHYHSGRWLGWYQNRFLLHFCQSKKKQHLINNAQQLPYYRDYRGAAFEDFPIMDKSTLQESFSQLNNRHLSIEQALGFIKKNASTDPKFLHAHASLGTTGSANVFLFSQAELLFSLGNVLNKLVQSLLVKKIAVFHLSSVAYFPKDFSYLGFKWCFLDLREDFAQLSLILQAFQPQVLIAPVQTLCKLADYQESKKISLHLKKIVSTAEILTSTEEKKITTAFKQQIYQLYQCAEGWLGTTCEYGTLHLNEDLFFIEKEWVDKEKKRFIPIITALNRHTQPLIRYRMEDILMMKSQPCLCNNISVAVEKIVSRCEDVIYLPHKYQRNLKPVYNDDIYAFLSLSGGELFKYQIIQNSPYQLLIKIAAKNIALAKNSIKQQFIRLCETQEIRCPYIEFQLLEDNPSQMFRQTKRIS